MSQDNDLIGKKFPVLDDGSLTLLDFMGNDSDIANAARVSYGKGTRKVSEDRDLIRYLWRNHHTSPFEMAEIKLHVRVPMDCWRQWIRHRTANVNEYSTRYSEAIDAAQRTPCDGWRLQAKDNKQGSVGTLTEWPENPLFDWGPVSVEWPSSSGVEPGQYLSDREKAFQDDARRVYEERLYFGVAREQARKDLPLSTYTEAIWKCDLRNVLGFLALRMDGHAQLEIRSYANVIGNEIVAKLFPESWAAFQDYTLNAMTLTALDIKVIRNIRGGINWESFALNGTFTNKREREECRAKMEKLGLLNH